MPAASASIVLESSNRRACATYGQASRLLWIAPALAAMLGAAFLFHGSHERVAWNLGTTLGSLSILTALVAAMRRRGWAKVPE